MDQELPISYAPWAASVFCTRRTAPSGTICLKDITCGPRIELARIENITICVLFFCQVVQCLRSAFYVFSRGDF